EKLPDSVHNYIIETKNIVDADLKAANNTLNALDKLVQPVIDVFDSMNKDTKFIDRLDLFDNYDFLHDWKIKLAYLFGQSGTEPESRVSLLVEGWRSLENQEKITTLEKTLTELSAIKRQTNKETQEIINHAINIIEHIINQLEINM
ncbi:MAG: hypothetical protein LBH59_08690, partial [Planctomycetaceae bacterium]|nr:hypothetical protein [Planctomycetaceae bacterium]